MNLDWLIATPIAHRGLHDRSKGVIENTASAARAAIARGFTIESDVQRTADGEAVVFHDFALERLTDGKGKISEITAAATGRLALRGTADRVMLLRDFLDVIGGRVPVIIEVKSAFDSDLRLADRTAEVVASYAGPLVLKSFDPEIVAHLRGHPAFEGRPIPRGIVAEANYEQSAYAHLTPDRRRALSNFLFFEKARPDFISYRGADLPSAAPYLCRTTLGLPILAWTMRTLADAEHARPWADQIIFEGFDPACRR